MAEDALMRYERLLMSSPSYRTAPPVRADDGYDAALEKWRRLGGDSSRLTIERSRTTSPQADAHVAVSADGWPTAPAAPRQPDGGVRTASSRVETALPPHRFEAGSPRTAADFLAAAREHASPRSHSVSKPMNATRVESIHSQLGRESSFRGEGSPAPALYQPTNVTEHHRARNVANQVPSSVARGLSSAIPNRADPAPQYQHPNQYNETLSRRTFSVDPASEEMILREPPPPPQRPYTVEWIVSSPHRGRVNPVTGYYESETITPVPDFTGDSQPSLPSSTPLYDHPQRTLVKNASRVARGPSSSLPSARPRSQSPRHHALRHAAGSYSPSRSFGNDDLPVDDEEERMALVGDSVSGDPKSVSRILLMLDEFDERRQMKQSRRSELARLHRQYVADTLVLDDGVERRLREQAEQLNRERERLRVSLQQVEDSERQSRESLISEERSHGSAIMNMEARLTSDDLRAARVFAIHSRLLYEEEFSVRREMEELEHSGRVAVTRIAEASRSSAVQRTQSRIERRLNEIRNGDPVEQRKEVEDEEEVTRFEHLDVPEADEWATILQMIYLSKPMFFEDLNHRRFSLGFHDDLLDEMNRDDTLSRTSFISRERRLDDGEEREPTPLSHFSQTASTRSDLDSMDAYRHNVGQDGNECLQYLQEIYESHNSRAKKIHYGYNRNGWRYSKENPDPLRFAGVKAENGKLFGASSPVFKEAVRQFLTPSSRAIQRGDTTVGADFHHAHTTALPPGAVIVPQEEAVPMETVITKQDEEEMLNILRNIKKKKTFTWPRHYASVRDRPSFPQDAEWEIYRREPGPNMGNSKRYHDVIDEEYAAELNGTSFQ